MKNNHINYSDGDFENKILSIVQNAECGMQDLLKIKELLEKYNDSIPLSLTVISNNKSIYNK